MTTTDMTLHEAIASDELLAALARFAAVEASTEAEGRRVDEAEAELLAADPGDAAQRDLAAGRLAGLRLLAERNGPARLDGPGLIAVRRATAAGMHYMVDLTEYAPLTDPRDQPKRLRPDDRATIEGQARLRLALASIRREVDTWARVPERFALADVARLLGRLSDGCRAADHSGRSSRRPLRRPLLSPATKRQRK